MDVNARDRHDETPLHHACSRNCAKIAEILLRYRADVNAQNKYVLYRNSVFKSSRAGETALHKACNLGHVEIVKLVLAFQARIDIVAENQGTPLQVATANHHAAIVSILEGFDSKGILFLSFSHISDFIHRSTSSTANSDDVDLGNYAFSTLFSNQ